MMMVADLLEYVKRSKRNPMQKVVREIFLIAYILSNTQQPFNQK